VIYCGIDPGLHGGIAFLTVFDSGVSQLTTYPMPVQDDGIDSYRVLMLLNNWKPDRLILEDQFANKLGKMSKQSILSMGQNWGKIVGAAQALKIKVHVVLPNVWQAKLCPKKLFQFADTKERAYAAARMFAPVGHNFVLKGKVKFHDGMTDATCLAKYGHLYCP